MTCKLFSSYQPHYLSHTLDSRYLNMFFLFLRTTFTLSSLFNSYSSFGSQIVYYCVLISHSLPCPICQQPKVSLIFFHYVPGNSLSVCLNCLCFCVHAHSPCPPIYPQSQTGFLECRHCCLLVKTCSRNNVSVNIYIRV